jgi:protein-S-isoprenylcysteine O-methyltransferase Ste14
MSWSLVPLLHALAFACVAVLGRLVLVWRRLGALPLTLRTGGFARDFTARWFYIGLPLVDFAYLLIYAVSGSPGPAIWEGVLDSDEIRVAGVAFLVTGLAWVAYAQAAMGANWRMGVDDGAQGALCTRGPFARSRHPVYLGIRVTMLGQLLVIGSWPAFCLWIVEEILVQIQARFEEAAMDARFGSAYQAYRASVRRWL